MRLLNIMLAAAPQQLESGEMTETGMYMIGLVNRAYPDDAEKRANIIHQIMNKDAAVRSKANRSL